MSDGRVRSCLSVGREGGKGGKGAARLRIGSWNLGTLTEKFL